MKHFKKIILIFSIMTIAVSCSSTTVTVKSNPSGANVVFERSGVSLLTDSTTKLPSSMFPNGRDYVRDTLVFEKSGYRKSKKTTALTKGEHHDILIDLEKLDTTLNITSPVSPISLEFVLKKQGDQKGFKGKLTEYRSESDRISAKRWNNQLPEGWPLKFTTPIHLECTKEEMAALIQNVNLKIVEFSGYIPTGKYRSLSAMPGMPLALKGNHKNNLEIPLKPIVTSLQVITSPAGAIVEDVSSGGFGYIGETPVVRNFNWEDVVQWSERKRSGSSANSTDYKRKNLYDSSLYLDLRITKAGFEESYLRQLRLPIGEERSFHKNLKELVSKINFSSDPVGAHVYVLRNREKEIFDEKAGQFKKEVVHYKKHLGTTPFTFNIDPSDPLSHGERLIFKKSGYEDAEMRFADGNASYYEVMTPKKVMER